MDDMHKSIALCDAIKNVIEDLQILDQRIQDAGNFILEEDDATPANDPQHDTAVALFKVPARVPMPDSPSFQFEGSPPLKPHENFFERLHYVVQNEFDGSVNALANACDISQKTLWTWLSEGKGRSPSFAMMYEVCDKLGWNYHDALRPF